MELMRDRGSAADQLNRRITVTVLKIGPCVRDQLL